MVELCSELLCLPSRHSLPRLRPYLHPQLGHSRLRPLSYAVDILFLFLSLPLSFCPVMSTMTTPLSIQDTSNLHGSRFLVSVPLYHGPDSEASPDSTVPSSTSSGLPRFFFFLPLPDFGDPDSVPGLAPTPWGLFLGLFSPPSPSWCLSTGLPHLVSLHLDPFLIQQLVVRKSSPCALGAGILLIHVPTCCSSELATLPIERAKSSLKFCKFFHGTGVLEEGCL